MKSFYIYPALIFLTLIAACSHAKYRMQDCQAVGNADGHSLYDCDIYKSSARQMK